MEMVALIDTRLKKFAPIYVSKCPRKKLALVLTIEKLSDQWFCGFTIEFYSQNNFRFRGKLIIGVRKIYIHLRLVNGIVHCRNFRISYGKAKSCLSDKTVK